jgi:large subunit ribosomal protein LP0
LRIPIEELSIMIAHFSLLQVRRALKTFIPDSPDYERLLPFVKGNVGFVFTNGDLKEVRDKILANKVAAPARAGALAPVDVWVPAGNTGMEPGKTSFFQALQVPTKIARGTIEITQDLKLVESGSKVGASEATLLNMLNISPFTYGMKIAQVYDQGNTFPPDVLDIGEDQLLKAFASAITTIASVSLAINYPTLPSVFHSLVNSYKNVLAVAVETDYSWKEIEELKDRIANPDAYASAAPAATETTAEAPKEDEADKKDSDKEDGSDSDGGFGGLLLVPLQTNLACARDNSADTFPATKSSVHCMVLVLRACLAHAMGLGAWLSKPQGIMRYHDEYVMNSQTCLSPFIMPVRDATASISELAECFGQIHNK